MCEVHSFPMNKGNLGVIAILKADIGDWKGRVYDEHEYAGSTSEQMSIAV